MIDEEIIGTSDTDESTTEGIVDRAERKKKMRKKEDVGETSLFIKWFEKYLNGVYSSFYKKDGKVIIKPGHEGGFVNMDSFEVILYEKLISDLWDSGVPPLLVFYHEVGHVLYTEEPLIDYGKALKTEVMFRLLNWLEDFYIEDQLMKSLYFIKPYIKMLHEVVPDFIDDWERPEFAFNYYYCYEGLAPRWMSAKGIDKEFTNYIVRLKHLRASFSNKFAREKFIRMFEDFYIFCIKYGVLTKDTPDPTMDPRTKKYKKDPDKGTGAKGKGERLPEKEPGTEEEGAGGSRTETSEDDEDSSTPGKDLISGDAYAEDEGEDNPESKTVRPPFKPLDPIKGFDPTFKDLLDMLKGSYERSLFDSFELGKNGKPTITPRTVPTASPRSMIDPVAIATNSAEIYLEYTTEEFSYTAYNLFIDVSGSVGFNLTYNTLARDIIKIISHFPYSVYGYGNDVIKWDQKKIDDILNLDCIDGTESQLIGDIILEKKELGNLNIVLSDGDLGNLCQRPDIKEITKQYLFVFVVARSDYAGYAKKYLAPNQYYTLKSIKDLPKGIAALQKYIKSKGL